MKIGYVSLTIDPSLGFGIDRYSYDLMQELVREGVGIEPCTAKDPFAFKGKARLEMFFLLPLRAAMRKSDCDLYHFTSPLSGMWTGTVRAMRRKKVVTTMHDIIPVLEPKTERLSFLIRRALRSAARDSDVLIAVSSLTKKDVVEEYGIDPSKVVVTPLGVAEKFKPQNRKPNGKFTIGYIGRFDGYKDVASLIRAYSVFERNDPGASRLLLYGKGAKHEECMRLCSSLGLTSVEFMGFAPEESIVDIYNSFDLFAFPSNLEGFGLPIMEAQKCGIPVLVKEGAHIPEEVTRFCLKGRGEQGMADQMERVRSKGFRLTAEHKEHLSRFTLGNCAKRTIEAYGLALGKR